MNMWRRYRFAWSFQIISHVSYDTSLSQPLFNTQSSISSPHIVMPATRTTKSKATTASSGVRTAEPVKRSHQHNAEKAVNGTVPADITEPAIAMASAGDQKSRKAAAIVSTGSTDVDMAELWPKAGKHKHNLELTNNTQEELDNQHVKRSKATPANADEIVEKCGRGCPHKEVMLPRAQSLLPACLSQKTYPVTPKGSWRSTEQVALDNAAKKAVERKLLEEQIRLGEMVKQQFAQMQIDDEQADVEMQRRNPAWLSAAKCNNQPVCMQIESADEEEFNFNEVENMPLSELEVVIQPVRKRKVSFIQGCILKTNEP
jgi:hypothetical protein